MSEHINAIKCIFSSKCINGKIKLVKYKNDLDKLNALIIPGGESTTISKILYKTGLYDSIVERINKGNLWIMGTCAGCVLLAKEVVGIEREYKPLCAMNMKVKRNAFGRQKESFERNINIKGLNEPYNAVFIRAPIIKEIWGECKILSKINNDIIAAREDKFLALSFHPELTNDLRIHEYFLQMID